MLSAHGDGEERWNWVRWLPHCAPRGGEDCLALVGADPEAAARRVSELATLIEERLDDGRRLGGASSAGSRPAGRPRRRGAAAGRPVYDERPYDVLVVLDGAQVLRALPGMPQVLRQGPRAGVYTLAVDGDQRLLPEECATVAAVGPRRHGPAARRRPGRPRRDPGRPGVAPPGATGSPAPWPRSATSAGTTELGPARVRAAAGPAGAAPGRGRPSPNAGAAAPRPWSGVGPDGPFSVDLRRDGPHALIAGTTGAGKSELLQTLICSLAVANRPDEMTFVLIDYKGGAAFKECVRLPHTVGMVSDLDGHLTQRALASLAAEIRRREHAAAAAAGCQGRSTDYAATCCAGASSRRRCAAALPRLVLVIDEFAAMVRELPDFVSGLVDIASAAARSAST